MRRITLFVLTALLLVVGCTGGGGPDYFPLVSGSRSFMKVYTRKVVGSDTTEQIQVRLVSIVLGEKDIPGLDRVHVIEAPRDSGPSTYTYFRRDRDGIVQVIPLRGREPTELRYLKTPLSKGRGWYDTDDKREAFEVVAKETVTVEAGVFPDCYKIAIISTKVDWAMHQWFAPDVGPVKWENRAAWTKDGVNHELVRTAELVLYELPGSPPAVPSKSGE